MLEYLNDVDHMICKDGFGTINEMIDLSNKRVDNHITQYQKLQTQLESMQKDALESMQSISQYDKVSSQIAREAYESQKRQTEEMAIVQEESFHEREEESRKPKEHMPLEKQKSTIIETLSKMTNSMNSFTTDVEGRMGEVIKSVGGLKKYGIDPQQQK